MEASKKALSLVFVITFSSSILAPLLWGSTAKAADNSAAPAPIFEDSNPLPTSTPQSPGEVYNEDYLPILMRGNSLYYFEEFSYYIGKREGLFDLGRRRALSYKDKYDNWFGMSPPPPESGFAIINLGAVEDTNKIHSWEDSSKTHYELDNAALRIQDYIEGFCWEIRDLPYFLELAVGVNTSKTPVEAEHGENFAAMINDLNGGWRRGMPCAQVEIIGAIDTEPAWSASPQEVKDWITSYKDETAYELINFGSADGCPKGLPPTEPEDQPGIQPEICAAGNSQWTQEDMREVSTHGMFPIPEIYATDGDNARQWYRIALYSDLAFPSRKTFFRGTLTQHFACLQDDEGVCRVLGTDNEPNEGHLQLYTEIFNDPYDRIPLNQFTRMTDILWYDGRVTPWCLHSRDYICSIPIPATLTPTPVTP